MEIPGISSIFHAMDASSFIEISTPAPHVTLLRLMRPEAANAINTRLSNQLKDAFQAIDTQNTRVVILTGSGEKVFSAGADLKERKGMDETAWASQHHAFEAMLEAVLHCPLPTIAAVNGAAYGGGFELALACDFILASEHARFALTEATLGIMPGLGGTQTLPRRIGTAKALEILYTGLPMNAEEARAATIANRVFPAQSLFTETLATATRIAQNAPLSLKAIKRAVREGMALPLEEAIKGERSLYNTLIPTADRHEGINAFNEKRPARFRGN